MSLELYIALRYLLARRNNNPGDMPDARTDGSPVLLFGPYGHDTNGER